MEPPRGVFGVPHGVLSSPDEWVALGIGVIALVLAVAYDRELAIDSPSGAASVGIAVALAASFLARPAVTEEWHIPALVVLVVVGGVAYTRRR